MGGEVNEYLRLGKACETKMRGEYFCEQTIPLLQEMTPPLAKHPLEQIRHALVARVPVRVLGGGGEGAWWLL